MLKNQKVTEILSFVKKNIFAIFSILLILNNLAATVQRIFIYAINHYETQNMHIFWKIANGAVPYKDFFTLKGPLYLLFNSFIYKVFLNSQNFDVFFDFRVLHFSFYVLSAVLLFLICRLLNRSLNFALVTVAISFMWHLPNNQAFTICELPFLSFIFLLSIFFYLLAYKNNIYLYFFAFFLSSLIFIDLKMIFVVIIFLFFLFSDKNFIENKNRLSQLLIGFVTALFVVLIFFFYKYSISEFFKLFFDFNLFDIPSWQKDLFDKQFLDLFLKQDIVLVVFFLLALAYVVELGFIAFLFLSLIFTVFYLSSFGFDIKFVAIVLPLASFVIAYFFDTILLSYLSKLRLLPFLIFVFSFCFLFGNHFGHTLVYKESIYSKDINEQKVNFNFFKETNVNNLKIPILTHACPAFAFQNDLGFYFNAEYKAYRYSGLDLQVNYMIQQIEQYDLPYFLGGLTELNWSPPEIQNYLKANYVFYDNLPGSQRSPFNCIWMKKELVNLE